MQPKPTSLLTALEAQYNLHSLAANPLKFVYRHSCKPLEIYLHSNFTHAAHVNHGQHFSPGQIMKILQCFHCCCFAGESNIKRTGKSWAPRRSVLKRSNKKQGP